MTFLAELQELVECQSPTEDLEACVRVVNLAAEIVARNLSTPARVFTEKGRPVVWWGSETPRSFSSHISTQFGQPTPTYLSGR
jgi:glutamate carboxypeptidase